MRQRDKSIKTERHKTSKRRNAPKAASKETNVARLTRELVEAREQQAATADVLKIISRPTFDLQVVLDTLVQLAAHLCAANDTAIFLREGEKLRVAAHHGASPITVGMSRPLGRGFVGGRSVLDRAVVHVADLAAAGDEFPLGKEIAQQYGHRTTLGVPLLVEDKAIGCLLVRRPVVEPFAKNQIALLQTFAAQAVIAIENGRLLNELRQRTDDLSESLEQQTATSEVLKVISSSSGKLEPVFQTMLANATRICEAAFGSMLLIEGELFRRVALHNAPPAFVEFNKNSPVIPLGQVHDLNLLLDTRRPVHIADAAGTADSPIVKYGGARTLVIVPMLKESEIVGAIGIYRQEVRPFTDKQIELVTNFAAQAVIAIENARLLNELRQRTYELATSLDDLRTTQDRLVQTEKLASLGQLTAGIAHEIKNPLNFVNNFSGISTELIGELQHTLSGLSIDPEAQAEIKELTNTLRGNLEKVVHHGKRADAIVKSMLLHSGESSGQHQSTDINALVEESLNRAYYNARAEQRGFTIKLERSFDPAAGEADLFPREITRALLNLISNGFYAATKRKAEAKGGNHEPTLAAATKNLGDRVEIRIRDNGTGIPADVKEKMFDPFFTTKPAGEGTGLGLSISHDIIVKQHAGAIEVDTHPGEFTEIRVTLPRAATLLSERS
jgi:two-component system NtrC family sensor kinase